jgi:hypothetical protein
MWFTSLVLKQTRHDRLGPGEMYLLPAQAIEAKSAAPKL